VFQDGTISLKVNQVAGQGVFYFAAAGNQGNLLKGFSGTWQGDFVDSQTPIPALPVSGVVHSFNGANNNQLLGESLAGYYQLDWSDPLGHSTNDYDLFILNASLTAVVASSTNIQSGGQDPHEAIIDDPGAVKSGNRIVVVKHSTAAPRALYLDTESGL